MKYEPRKYQQHAIKELLSKPHHGLFLEPGLGKTSIVLAALQLLKQRKFVSSQLVIAPLQVCFNVWPLELEKWDQFKTLRCRILHGKDRTLERPQDVDLWLINPEGLPWLVQQLIKTARWPFDWLVVDESTRFKHTNTKRFKLLKTLLSKFTRRTILTGTPTPNGLLDLFGQMFVVDQGRVLGRFITHYRQEFFYPSGYGGYEWTPQPDAEKRILARVKPVTTTMLAADWLELPERINNLIYVELPPAARKIYVQFEKELIAKLERGEIVAANTGVATGKCRQVANGGVYDNDRNVHELHEAKVDAIESIVEELQGSPLLVVHQYQHDQERLLKRFPKALTLKGGQTPTASKHVIDEWNAGRVEVLLAQADKIYHGLNLQEGTGHTMAFFGLTWDFEIYDQVIKRLWRGGQAARRVVVHHVLARNTVDETMYQVVVVDKQTDQRRVLVALKERLLKRSTR